MLHAYENLIFGGDHHCILTVPCDRSRLFAQDTDKSTYTNTPDPRGNITTAVVMLRAFPDRHERVLHALIDHVW